MDNEDIPHISCDNDWLDLRVGEQGRLTGKLNSALRPGSAAVMVTTVDWDILYAAIPGGYQGNAISEGKPVEVTITRTEDGMSTTTEAIKEVRE
jgi:hypothetical protein